MPKRECTNVRTVPPGIPDERGWRVFPYKVKKGRDYGYCRATAKIGKEWVNRSFPSEAEARAWADEQNAINAAHHPKPKVRAEVLAEELLTDEELAAKLKMTGDGVRNLKKRGFIPFVKIGHKLVRFRYSEVLLALEARRLPFKLEGGIPKQCRIEAATFRNYRFRAVWPGGEKRFRTREEAEGFAQKKNSTLGNIALGPLPERVRGMLPSDPLWSVAPATDRPGFRIWAKIDGKPKNRFARTEREALKVANTLNFEVAKEQVAATMREEAAEPHAAAPAIAPAATALTCEPVDMAKKGPYTVNECNDPRYTHYVRVRSLVTGRPERKFFTSARQAKAFAHAKNTEVENQGTEVLSIPSWLRTMAQRCNEKLAARGASIEDATRHYLDYLDRTNRSLAIGKMVVELVKDRKAAGVSHAYTRNLDTYLTKFAAFVGAEVFASEIDTAKINDFVATFNGNTQRNNTRQLLSTLFGFGVERGWCRANPVLAATIYKITEKPVEIFQPEQLAALLRLVPEHWVPFLAIGAFAGLRVAELRRLDWAQVDLEDGYIEVTALNAKSARRRLVKILPCLDAWIRPIAKASGPIYPFKVFQATNHLGDYLKPAGIDVWPRNGLRHSFASYHIAQFKDAAALALEMGHTTTNLIFQHYRQVVKSAEAAKFWAILPTATGGKVVALPPAGSGGQEQARAAN